MKKYELRRINAVSLRKKRALLSPKEQLTKLDNRLGVGVGAVKERTRLNKIEVTEPFKKKTKGNK